MEILLDNDKRRTPFFIIPIGCLVVLLISVGSIYLIYRAKIKTQIALVNSNKTSFTSTKHQRIVDKKLKDELKENDTKTELKEESTVSNNHATLNIQNPVRKRKNLSN